MMLVLVVGLLVTAAVPAAADHFDDVPGDHPFHGHIGWLVGADVAEGFADGTFRPTQQVTRQAAAAFMHRLAGQPSVSPTAAFSDVPIDHPFAEAITWLVQEGIAEGFADGTFGPTQPVTRQAAAAFLYRYDGRPVVLPTEAFSDVPVSHPFAAEITWTVSAGLTTGFADVTFRPSLDVSRQAIAAFLYRYEHGGDPPAPGEGSFGDGVHVVGADVRPGTYRNSDSSQGCYWERLYGFSGELSDIIANEFTDALTIVEIAAGDVGFSASRCGTWMPIENTYPASPLTSFGPGSYVVGEHIVPGTYVNSASDGCYWARLSGFGGRLADIIANQFTDDTTIVTIAPTDTGFSSTRCGTWSLR